MDGDGIRRALGTNQSDEKERKELINKIKSADAALLAALGNKQSRTANTPGVTGKSLKGKTMKTLQELREERTQKAARMSELLGCEITAGTLNNYTAEAHDKHRFPCQYLPAFVVATGGQRRAFDVLSRHAGLFALPGADALRAEIQRIDEDIKHKREEKLKRLLFLKEINKP